MLNFNVQSSNEIQNPNAQKDHLAFACLPVGRDLGIWISGSRS